MQETRNWCYFAFDKNLPSNEGSFDHTFLQLLPCHFLLENININLTLSSLLLECCLPNVGLHGGYSLS